MFLKVTKKLTEYIIATHTSIYDLSIRGGRLKKKTLFCLFLKRELLEPHHQVPDDRLQKHEMQPAINQRILLAYIDGR